MHDLFWGKAELTISGTNDGMGRQPQPPLSPLFAIETVAAG